jgi:succinoglycan biosynthesis transport protein ExoP
MNPSLLLLALRARYKIVLLALGVTVLVAMAITLTRPKAYVAGVSMVVNYKGVDPVTGLSVPAQLMPGYIATQVDIIKSRSVALKVVDNLKLDRAPDVQANFQKATGGTGTLRDWLADSILGGLDVVPARDSSVLTISYKGKNPETVARMANAFADAYLDVSVQLKINPVQRASGYITTQIKALREKFELAQSRLSKYQKDNNIYSADNRADVETARLNELSSQLVSVQSQGMDASSRRSQVQGNSRSSPDVMNNPVVQNLQNNLSQAEVKFAEVSQRLARNHPQYIAAKSEVDKLRANLQEQIRVSSGNVAATADITERRESELRAAVADQKAKVQALNGSRNEFNVLTNEMETARHAYELASQRLNQISLEGQSKEADIAILTAATPPLSAAGPRMLTSILLAAVVGTILGLGGALLLELLDQRVRSASHLSDAFDLPVLGVIPTPQVLGGTKKVPARSDRGNIGGGRALPAHTADQRTL